MGRRRGRAGPHLIDVASVERDAVDPLVVDAAAPPDWRHDPATLAHLLTLVLGGLGLLWVGRDLWFTADEWAFVVRRGVLHAPVGLFEPHLQHWVTGPILVYRALLSVFGLRTYLPFLLVGVLVHLLVVHLSWRVAVRAGARRWVATGLAAVLLVASSSAPEALHPFQITLNGSVACGLGLLLLADARRPLGIARALGTSALAIVSLTFSAVSIPLIGTAALVLLLRRGWRATLGVFAPAGAVFAVWYLAVGRDALSNGPTRVSVTGTSLREAPSFVWQGLRHAVGGPLHVQGWLTAVLLVGIAAALVVALVRSWRGPALVGIAAALGALAFFAVTALGRADLGPTASRYLYVAGALLLPAAALAIGPLWSRGGIVVRVALAVVLGVVLVVNVRDTRRTALAEGQAAQVRRSHLLTVAQVVRDHPDVPGAVVPELSPNPDITVGALRTILREGWLPGGGARPARFPDTARYPVVSVTRRPVHPVGADAPEVGPGAETGAVTGGCTAVPAGGRASIVADAPASVRVTPSAPSAILVWATDDAGRPVGMPLRRDFASLRPVYVNLERAQHAAIAPYYAPFTLCGVTP